MSRTFIAAGGAFDEVFSNGTFINRGSIANDSQPVSMAASAQELLIASGGSLYLFNLQTNGFSTIPAANFTGPVAQVGYCDGFFIVLIKDTNRFYVSGPLDANDWTSNGAALVSEFPDNLISMLVDHRQVWFWSATKAIVYFDSGNQFPFDPVPSGFIEQGIAAEFSPARLDNTIFWLGSDDRGSAIVWRAIGYTPSRVSNHALEYAMQGYVKIDDAVGYAFQMQGHSFYQLSFPAAGKTWRYDVATGMWHEVGFWDANFGFFKPHLSQFHTFNFGKHLVGGPTSAKVYDMEIPKWNNGVWDFATDDGSPIRRVRRAAHVSDEQHYSMHHQIQLFLETGLGPVPPLPGSETPTSFILADPTGALWSLGVTDVGVLTTTGGAIGNPGILILTDSVTGTTSWQVQVNNIGVLTTIPVTFLPQYSTVLQMVSSSGTKRWTLFVNQIGLLQTSPGGDVFREPMVSIRWSDDSAHTFGNEYMIGCGFAGEFAKRVMMRRLGRARDRVYEISMSDPIPWRIIAGYLEYAGSGDSRGNR